MIATLNRYPVISGLGAIGVVFAAIVVFELVAGSMLKSPSAGGAPQRVAAVQVKLLPPVDPVSPEQAYPETGSRPLFTPTRRPAPAAAAPAASTMTKGQYALSGVTIVGPLRIALLREKASGRVVRVEQGKEVNGITVAEIEPEQVTLTQGGDREVVSLLVSKGGAPAGAAVAGPGPFAGPATPAAPAAAAPAMPTAQPAPVNPAARPPGFGPRGFGPNAPEPATPPQPATGQQAAPQPQTAPMSPEELLARRRARRTQQTN